MLQEDIVIINRVVIIRRLLIINIFQCKSFVIYMYTYV